jgi:hypothetical protein
MPWNWRAATGLTVEFNTKAQFEETAMRPIALALILLSTSTVGALAQGHMGTPQEQQACSRDASRFCRPMLGDDGAVQGCLQQHRAGLSASCRKVFESHGM